MADMDKSDHKTGPFLEELCRRARELGALEAVAIDAGDIVLDERAVLKCQVPRCANYGKLTCPPNSLAFTDFQRILSRYHSAIVLRVDNSGLGKPEDKSGLGNLSHI
jgi:predicted metal-binding protein